MSEILHREPTLQEKCLQFKNILEAEKAKMEELGLEEDIIYPLELIESFFSFNSNNFVGALPRDLRIELGKIGIFARKVRNKSQLRFGGEELKSRRWKML